MQTVFSVISLPPGFRFLNPGGTFHVIHYRSVFVFSIPAVLFLPNTTTQIPFSRFRRYFSIQTLPPVFHFLNPSGTLPSKHYRPIFVFSIQAVLLQLNTTAWFSFSQSKRYFSCQTLPPGFRFLNPSGTFPAKRYRLVFVFSIQAVLLQLNTTAWL